MSSEAAQKAYPANVGPMSSGFVDHLNQSRQEAFDRGAVEALRRAAELADSTGHHWSGAPALEFFRLAEAYRVMADEWERGSA